MNKCSNNQGKTLTIFLVVISVLLLSLTAIMIFFYQKESEMRKALEDQYSQAKAVEEQLEKEKKDLKKEMYLLEEKTKEADEKINSVMDELDLEKGLREAAKSENTTLKEQLTTEKGTQDALKDEITKSQREIEALKIELEKQKSACISLGEDTSGDETAPPGPTESIQVNPDLQGKVLSVNQENNFVVFDLGSANGISEGMLMSIYSGNKYLGDVKVSRIQTKMAVADLIAPLASKDVKENDKVLVKK